MARGFGNAWGKKVSKYRAQKVEVDGIKFDSKHEQKCWAELCLLERAGKIDRLERQVKLPLIIDGGPVVIRSALINSDGNERKGREVHYIADFRYFDKERNETIIGDAKGFFTAESKLKIAVVERIYNIRVKIL